MLKLTASDGTLTGQATVAINVTPGANVAPAVNAGANQTVRATTQLNGSATDDGLPLGSGLSFAWSQVSGPGAAAFTNARAAATAVTFPVRGVYVLRLTVSDTQLSSSAQVTITVAEP